VTATPATRRINRGRGHSYLLDGAPVQGVTTCLSEGYPKPALVNWAATMTAGYAVDNWDELAEMGVAARLKKLEKARWDVTREAAVRGTAVHDIAQRLQAVKQRWLLDFKTSKGSPYPEVALQLAAYRYSDFYLDQAGNEQPMPPVDRCGVVWLRADGYDLIPIEAGPEAFEAFSHVQAVAAFRADPIEQWIGDTLRPPEATS
jgi:hypothetical protein